MNKGILYGLGAYLAWGVLPVYWKLLHSVPAAEILSHRILWSLLFVAIALASRRHWQWLARAGRDPKVLLAFAAASGLLGINWFTYIWAVNAGFIVESSLGYFINPLFNVLLGVLFFRERLRPWQWAAIALAGAGVLYLTVSFGALPWIALTLATTFGLYGVLKKTTALAAQEGLFLEMAILALPATLYLFFIGATGTGSFGPGNLLPSLLLPLSGVATALPLLMFAVAAPRIPLSVLGLLQYVAPTSQFLLGVLVYGEPFTHARLVGFSLIWTALALYSVEGLMERRRVAALRYAMRNS